MVPLDSALLAEAEALGLNVRDELEFQLRRVVDRHKAARDWTEENREAIEAYKRYLEEHGPFGEEWRSW